MNRAWLISPSRSLPICLAISSKASQRWSGMATLRTGCGGLKSPMARTGTRLARSEVDADVRGGGRAVGNRGWREVHDHVSPRIEDEDPVLPEVLWQGVEVSLVQREGAWNGDPADPEAGRADG